MCLAFKETSPEDLYLWFLHPADAVVIQREQHRVVFEVVFYGGVPAHHM